MSEHLSELQVLHGGRVNTRRSFNTNISPNNIRSRIIFFSVFISLSVCGSKNKKVKTVFSGVRVTRSLVLCVCFVDRRLSFCTFSFDHCVVCSS
jgi:hypothetical protein